MRHPDLSSRPLEEAMLSRVRAAGLKLTPQRLAVVRELAGDPTHPTAQELYERLLPAMPTMSFATVYNTLDALAAAGACAPRALAKGAARFDPNMAPHDHLVCDGCGLVRDVMAPGAAPAEVVSVGEAMAPDAARFGGFSVRSVETLYRGLCERCALRQQERPARQLTAPRVEAVPIGRPNEG